MNIFEEASRADGWTDLSGLLGIDIFQNTFGSGRKPKKVSLKQWHPIVHKMQNSKCMYSGQKLQKQEGEVDHKIPKSRGGKEVPKNMQLLCSYCNKKKGALTDSEFRKRFKAILPAKLPPPRPIPLSKFDAVAKEIAAKKAKTAKKRRKADQWTIF